MANWLREAEHKVAVSHDGRLSYRWKNMRVGDYIQVREPLEYMLVYQGAFKYSRRNPGWDFDMRTTPQTGSRLTRIA